jgi:hypothetical protein
MGRWYPLREAYPSNEDWGELAWSYGCSQLDEASTAFELLCQKHAAPPEDVIDSDLPKGHDSHLPTTGGQISGGYAK